MQTSGQDPTGSLTLSNKRPLPAEDVLAALQQILGGFNVLVCYFLHKEKLLCFPKPLAKKSFGEVGLWCIFVSKRDSLVSWRGQADM